MKKKILLFLLIICIYLSLYNNLENFATPGENESGDIRDKLADKHLKQMEQNTTDLRKQTRKNERLEKEIVRLKEEKNPDEDE